MAVVQPMINNQVLLRNFREIDFFEKSDQFWESFYIGSDEDEENAEIGGLIDDTDGISQSDFTTTRKQQSSGNLDAKIIKALKKQEEKRDKRALRKKEVRFLIVLTKNSTFVTKITNLTQCVKSCMTPVWTTWKW